MTATIAPLTSRKVGRSRIPLAANTGQELGRASVIRIIIGVEGGESQLETAARTTECFPFLYASDFPHEVDVESCKHEIEEFEEIGLTDEQQRVEHALRRLPPRDRPAGPGRAWPGEDHYHRENEDQEQAAAKAGQAAQRRTLPSDAGWLAQPDQLTA